MSPNKYSQKYISQVWPCQAVLLAASADWLALAEGPEEVDGWVQVGLVVGLVVAAVTAEVELVAALTLAVTLW